MEPHRPEHPPEYAQVCLQALADHGLGNKISLGGAFGLMHYFEYRHTHDIDAWWEPNATYAEQREVVEVVERALKSFGPVRTRSWGDVISVEVQPANEQVFSFQIARRSAQLKPSAPSPWEGILIDSFDDLVAGKMLALVERGAPRDFLDIFRLCDEGIVTPLQCWQLWRTRQELANSDSDLARARLAIRTHLARIEQHRPLEKIADDSQRTEAQRLRTWFKELFVYAFP